MLGERGAFTKWGQSFLFHCSVLAMALVAFVGLAVAPQAAWADSVTPNNPGISGATELKEDDLDLAIVRFVPTNWDYELNFHNDGNTNGCDLYTYYLGTSSKMQLHWSDEKQAYYIDFFTRFDESEKRGKVWDVDGQSTKDGAQVHAWSPGWDNDSMYWRFWQNADGTYYIQNKHSGGYVALEDTSANESGVRARLYSSTKMTFDVEVIDSASGFTQPYNNSTYADALDWMQYLPDDMKLSSISIPGTHDTGTNGADETHSQANLYECQKYFIDEQLNVGVRAFDIRLDGDDYMPYVDTAPDPAVVHTSRLYDRDGSQLRLSDVMQYLNSFLYTHPTETVIMMVKCNEGDDENIQKAMEYWMNRQNPKIWMGKGIPTLGEARGKVVVIRRYDLNALPKYDKSAYGIDATAWDSYDYSKQTTPIWVSDEMVGDYGESGSLYAQIYAQDDYKATSSHKVECVEDTWDWMKSKQENGSINGSPSGSNNWYDAYVFNYTSSAQGEPVTAPMDHARNVNLPLIQDGYAEPGKVFRGITMFDYIDGSWARSIFLSNYDDGEMPSFPSSVTITYGDDFSTAQFSDDGVTKGKGRYWRLKSRDTYYEVAYSGKGAAVELCEADGTVVASGFSTITVNPRVAGVTPKSVTTEYGEWYMPEEARSKASEFYELSEGAVCSDGVTKPDVVVEISSPKEGDTVYRSAGTYGVSARFATDSEVNKNYLFVGATGAPDALYEVTERVIELDWSNCRTEYEYTGEDIVVDVPEITNLVNSDGQGRLDQCELVVDSGVVKEAGAYTERITGVTGENSDNYTCDQAENTEFEYTVAPKSFEVADILLNNGTVTYGQPIGDAAGKASAVVSAPETSSGTVWISGTFTFDDPDFIPEVKLAGNGAPLSQGFEGTFTPDDRNMGSARTEAKIMVNQRPVTIQLNSATSAYGAPQPQALSEYAEVPDSRANAGLLEGDDLQLSLSIEGTVDDETSGGHAYNKTSVGEHAVMATAGNANYKVKMQGGTWTVEPRVAELAWENVTNRRLSDGMGDPSATVENALPGDEVLVKVGKPTCVKPGEVDGTGLYKVEVTRLLGDRASNYALGNDADRAYYVRKGAADCVFPSSARFTYGSTLAKVQKAQAFEGGSGDGTFGFIGVIRVTKTAEADGAIVSGGEVVTGATLDTVLDAGSYTVEGTMVFTPRDDSTSAEVERAASITVQVDQRPITVSAVNAEKEYGDKMPTLKAEVTSGKLVGGDSLDEVVSIAANGVRVDENGVNLTPVGSYHLEVSASDAVQGNYAVTCVNGMLSVYQRTLEFSWSGTKSVDGTALVYDGAAKSVTAEPTNLLADPSGALDDVRITVVGGNAVDAGTHRAFVTAIEGDDAGNYRLQPAATVGSATSRVQEYKIAQATPTVTWPTGTLSYGQALSDAVFSGGSATGVLIDGAAEGVAGSFAFAGDVDTGVVPDVGESGSYAVTFTPSSGNYKPVTNDVPVTVTVKSITVYIHNAASTFGDELPELDYTILGGTNGNGTPKALVNGDTVEDLGITLSVEDAEEDFNYGDAAHNRTAAGSYGIMGTAQNGNYAVTFVGYSRADDGSVRKGEFGTLTVLPREVELAWLGAVNDDGSELVYDGTAKNVTASANNMVPLSAAGGFDELGVTVEGGTETNAGSHTATATALVGNGAENYRLPEDASAAYAIAQAVPAIVSAPTARLTYGESLAQSNIGAGGQATGVGGAMVAGSFAFAGSSATIHPSVDNSLGAADATSYPITFTPTDSNYTTATALAGVSVAKRSVGVCIDDAQSTYGDPLSDLTFEVDDDALVLGDTVDDLAVTLSVVGGNADFEREGVAYNNTPVGTYQIEGFSDAANYEVAFGGIRFGEGELGIAYIAQNGTLAVVPREVTLSWSGATSDDGSSLVYDGEPQNVCATAGNLVPTSAEGGFDVVRVLVEGGDAVHAGSYTAMAVGLTDADGEAAANYCLPKDVGIGYEIAKAKPSVIWPQGGVAAVGDVLSGVLFDKAGSATGVDGATLSGTFAFVDPDCVIEGAGTARYAMAFTPDAIDGHEDYELVRGMVAVTASSEVDPGSGVGPNGGSQGGGSVGDDDRLGGAGRSNVKAVPDTSDAFGWVTMVCAGIAVCAAAVVAVCIAQKVRRKR